MMHGAMNVKIETKVALVWMLYDVVMDCGAASMGDSCATFRYAATLPRKVTLQSVSDTASYPKRKNSTVPLWKSENYISQDFDFDLRKLIS
jgi:hypothetical protein